MTKRLAGLLGMALVFSALASATTFTQFCGSAGANAPATGTGPFTPTLNSTATCLAFTIPAGQTLNDVQITFKNDWQLGFNTNPDTLNFTYTITGFNIGSMTSSVTGSGAGSIAPVGTNQGTCSVSGDTVTCDDPVHIVGPGTFNAVVIGISASWIAGGLDLSGAEGTTINEIFTYTPNATVPEPASMLMIGGGLIGLALAARRKFNA